MIHIDSRFEPFGLDFLLVHSGNVIISSMYQRSEQIVKAIGATINLENALKARVGREQFTFTGEYANYISPVRDNKEEFFHILSISKRLENNLFLTSKDEKQEEDDFYQILMQKFQLPLLKEWSRPLLELGKRRNYISKPFLTRVIFGKNTETTGRMIGSIPLEKTVVYDFSLLDEGRLKAMIRELFERGEICITHEWQEAMDETMTMDMYFERYGHTLVKNLESKLHPVSELVPVPDSVVLSRKRLYPQQGAITNGVIKLLDGRSSYCIMAEGMGCGKTVQAAAICDGYAVKQYQKKHPGESLSEIYSDPEKVKYRNIVMCPGHMVEKWKSEIEKEVPYSKVKILREFKDLIEIRNRGRERTEKEFYVMSKDFAKLSYASRPVPFQVKRNLPIYQVLCTDCNTLQYPANQCRVCRSKNLEITRKASERGSGLICHECGRLLFSGLKDGDVQIFSPKDFALPNRENQQCPYCKTHLWEPFVRNINQGFTHKKEKIRWKRASHYKNATQKGIQSVWVLNGHEKEYFRSKEVSPIKVKENMEGIRKYAPAMFIKKYMKGYFDIAVFDEAHLYKGGSTGQGNAMHALIKASKKQLALTGTLAGGKADHLFYMIYRLDPKRMEKYGWNGVIQFAEEYGSVEREYEIEEDKGNYSTYVRGRQKGSPKTKPGISPRVYTDFLLDRAVFLDISDMSKYLPAFKEKVVAVKMEDDVYDDYRQVIDILEKEGKKNLAIQSRKLQFALSYPDKPFSSERCIVHPKTGDPIVLIPDKSHLWKNGHLLPKEEKLIQLLKDEISEGRNCVVFAEFTASPDTCVTERLMAIIEEHVKVKTEVLHSASPAPAEREAWMHDQAERGVRIFITNPRCVETGLDFCWTKNGVDYNFPTLIFYQLGYSLFTVWQASRRAYRLIQKEECRVYYMAYEETVQTSVISLIAQKQVATSAIQGKFSTEGIAAMASGVDERVALAAAMSSSDYQTGNSLQGMFDILQNQTEDGTEDEEPLERMLILRELIGEERFTEIDRMLNPTADELFDDLFSDFFGDDENEENEIQMGDNVLRLKDERKPSAHAPKESLEESGVRSLAMLFA